MREYELKERLSQLQAEGFQFAQANGVLFDLALEMARHIGSVDPVLRDDLIYTGFAHLITKDILTDEQRQTLLGIFLNGEHLGHGLGENGTDSVFTRSFSALAITCVLYADNQCKFLPASTVTCVREQMLSYLQEEQDLRGYVDVKGWAHSVAHSADVFRELVRNSDTEVTSFPTILEALLAKTGVWQTAYTFREDERLAVPVIEMLKRGLTEEQLTSALEDLSRYGRDKMKELPTGAAVTLLFNIRSYQKSLYFALKTADLGQSVQDRLTGMLAQRKL